jgi:Domain of unknown function (DUF4365)
MRYSETERIGVYETGRIISKELKWVFREQPIVDVGIDAFIEQSINGKPTGKFISAQIKTGLSHFLNSDKFLTIYISNIHKYYWLNLDFPIILIAHIPETDKTYWEVINEKTLKKTKKHWKIEIPKRQELNSLSIKRLTELITDKTGVFPVIKIFNGENIENDYLPEILTKMEGISDANDSINRIVNHVLDLSNKVIESNQDFENFNKKNLTDKSPETIRAVKVFSKNMNISAKRLENEIEIFAETFSEGVIAHERAELIYFFLTKDIEKTLIAKKTFENLPESFDKSLEGILIMRSGIEKLPNNYTSLKQAKRVLLSVIDMLINELESGKLITKKLIESIENRIKNNC